MSSCIWPQRAIEFKDRNSHNLLIWGIDALSRLYSFFIVLFAVIFMAISSSDGILTLFFRYTDRYVGQFNYREVLLPTA